MDASIGDPCTATTRIADTVVGPDTNVGMFRAQLSSFPCAQEDNNELSLDIAELEKFVDNLREELDEKDFISDDEAQALEETLALGNNSKTLKDLLQSAAFSDESDIVVGKDELIGMLLSEMKVCGMLGRQGLGGSATRRCGTG